MTADAPSPASRVTDRALRGRTLGDVLDLYPEQMLGNVLLLPAAIRACAFRPSGPVTVLEAALPQ